MPSPRGEDIITDYFANIGGQRGDVGEAQCNGHPRCYIRARKTMKCCRRPTSVEELKTGRYKVHLHCIGRALSGLRP